VTDILASFGQKPPGCCTPRQVSPKYKREYRVKNWATCEEALREPGDITVWYDEEARSAARVPHG